MGKGFIFSVSFELLSFTSGIVFMGIELIVMFPLGGTIPLNILAFLCVLEAFCSGFAKDIEPEVIFYI